MAGVLSPRYSRCDGGPALPEDRLVIVGSTERGVVDLRGLDRAERADAISGLWP